ncbi:hypothetical protein [Natrinema sp. 1APR25-10V2]|uniref:hypothetical protein n=1 Tax=Natrinema sp. 1APR25-10V2 TaxID=2951081 RepID=UPI0028763291|nr:hypothetical protein [Natrinema sp. 1APR25-10V2]MDS0476806.1 hypothetical protein [Natrinema sp. 1APR25-10V2]
MPDNLETAIVEVRKSKVREEIVRELSTDGHLRPSEIYDRIDPRTDTTKENFYQNLRALTDTIVDRTEGSRRMTLYSLTETGEAVAEELGLTKTEREQLRSFASESTLSAEEVVDIWKETTNQEE